jgi:predicted Fe-Mo cluster-binding NifX family protein
MKIVVTSSGTTLEAQAHPAFGRCPTYLFIDTETMQVKAVENPAANAAGGAGIQAAQFVVERGAQAVVTGNVGPNAFQVLQPAGVPVYLFGGGTVRQAVEAYKAGELFAAGGASRPAHAGMGSGHGTPSREEEIAALRETARELRKQVAEVMERLDKLGAGTNTEGE